MNGYTLQAILLQYRGPWNEPMRQSLAVCSFCSIGLIVTQVGFPLVFLFPRTRWFFLPAALSFHLVARQTMETGPFIGLWFLLAAFVPLERVPDFVARTWSRSAVLGMLLVLACIVGLGLTLAIYLEVVPIALHRFLMVALVAILIALAGRVQSMLRARPDSPLAS